MKTAVSLMLIVCLTTSTLPVTAQQSIGTASGAVPNPARRQTPRTFVRIIGTEIERGAASGEPTSADLDAAQLGNPDESNWSRVVDIAPGTEILIKVGSASPVRRYLVRATQSELTVLNLTIAGLSPAVVRTLRDIASNHPEYLASTQTAGEFVASDVHVRSDGVFARDRKVADLGQIVERIARADVVVQVRPRGLSRGAAIAIGTGVSAAIAVVLLLFRARYCNEQRC